MGSQTADEWATPKIYVLSTLRGYYTNNNNTMFLYHTYDFKIMYVLRDTRSSIDIIANITPTKNIRQNE